MSIENPPITPSVFPALKPSTAPNEKSYQDLKKNTTDTLSGKNSYFDEIPTTKTTETVTDLPLVSVFDDATLEPSDETIEQFKGNLKKLEDYKKNVQTN